MSGPGVGAREILETGELISQLKYRDSRFWRQLYDRFDLEPAGKIVVLPYIALGPFERLRENRQSVSYTGNNCRLAGSGNSKDYYRNRKATP